ncbi:EAL domain-containing protein [Catenovulum agarivorans]|uniref:bifunctional diguanylate cyclase/phosphodiesterase n=1 Tax=Catenovulum agarivorans TaxID=1172192 RepID=UPI0002F247DB|nr:EAL domain-containing protein [Catenovulum agarivorans]
MLLIKSDNTIVAQSKNEAAKAVQQIHKQIEQQIFLFNWLAKQWNSYGQPEPFLWHQQARHIVESLDYVQAVEWADQQGVIRWIEPLIGNQNAYQLDLNTIPLIADKITQAGQTGSWVAVANWKLVQGIKGILFYVPIGKQEQLQGYIIGVVKQHSFFNSAIELTKLNGYNANVYLNDEKVFSSAASNFDTVTVKYHSSRVSFELMGELWHLELWPTQQKIEQQHDPISTYVFIVGLLISCLLSTLVQLISAAKQLNQNLTSTNRKLNTEISERQRIENEMLTMACQDELTSLNNRNAIYCHIKERLHHKANRDVALLLIDLDAFQQVNDVVGHNIGDQLLVKVAARLNKVIDKNSYLARIGGDEFAIFIDDVAAVSVINRVAQKILKAVDTKFVLDQYEFYTTASIGYVIANVNTVSVDDLIRKADSALNKAKSHGKNTIQAFDQSLEIAIIHKVNLLKKLNTAFENQAFELHYQPKIDLQSDKIIGVEALIRWFDEESKQWIPPQEFIPLAEESGIIVPLGDWIIEEACRQLGIWHKLGFIQLHVAINISGKQLKQQRLFQQIVKNYEAQGLRPHHIEIELTEEVFIENIEHNETFMRALVDQGISLSIDDFGIGYSSLAYLRNFPVDTLKIDRSFVKDLPMNDDDVAIVKAISDLAANMNLKVVAEGVENKMQINFLKEHNCQYAQGFWYSKPLSAPELTDKLIRNHNWM